MKQILIIGCGDIGRRVGQLALAAGHDVAVMARDLAKAEPMRNAGMRVCEGDLDQPDSLTALPCAGRTVFYFAPPPEHGVVDGRMANWLASMAHDRLPVKVVYISTTGVYGDAQGAWVDESTPPNPQTERGKRRLNAEQQLRAWGRAHQVAVVILRVPGIYGPGRIPVEAVRTGRSVVRLSEANYTNRIHADDLAAICLAAAEKGRPDEVYNVSDGQQSSMSEYFLTIADVLCIARPPEISWEQAQRELSPGLLSYLAESRRINNTKMLRELGVPLRYPTLLAGLRASLS